MFLVSNIAQNQNSIEQGSFLVISPTEFIFLGDRTSLNLILPNQRAIQKRQFESSFKKYYLHGEQTAEMFDTFHDFQAIHKLLP